MSRVDENSEEQHQDPDVQKFFEKVNSFTFQNPSGDTYSDPEEHIDINKVQKKVVFEEAVNFLTPEPQPSTSRGTPGIFKTFQKSVLRSGKIFRKSDLGNNFVKYTTSTPLDSNSISERKNNLIKEQQKLIEQQKEIINTQVQVIKHQDLELEMAHAAGNMNINENQNHILHDVDITKINNLISNNIPILTGENVTNLRSEISVFIRCCEYVGECLQGENERVVFLQLLRTRFRAKAAEALVNQTISSIDELKQLLMRTLLTQKPYYVLRNEINTLYQFPGESVESFGKRLRLLVEQCKEIIPEDSQEAKVAVSRDIENQAIHVFKSGIANTNLRWYCFSNSTNSLATLINQATEMENTERQTRCANMSEIHISPHTINTQLTSPTNEFGYNVGSVSPFGNIDTVRSSNQNKFVQNEFVLKRNSENSEQSRNVVNNFNSEYRNKSVQRNFNKNHLKCGFCGKQGHIYAECRTRQNTPYCTNCKVYGHNPQTCRSGNRNYAQPQINSISRNNTPKPHIKCNFCQRWGHKVDQCRAKVDWEKHTINQKQNQEN